MSDRSTKSLMSTVTRRGGPEVVDLLGREPDVVALLRLEASLTSSTGLPSSTRSAGGGPGTAGVQLVEMHLVVADRGERLQGTFTSPKLMAPVQTARGTVRPCPPTGRITRLRAAVTNRETPACAGSAQWVPGPHDRTRQVSSIPDRRRAGRDLRRQGPGDVLPADRAGAPACGRPERAGDPHRRRRLRRRKRSGDHATPPSPSSWRRTA